MELTSLQVPSSSIDDNCYARWGREIGQLANLIRQSMLYPFPPHLIGEWKFLPIGVQIVNCERINEIFAQCQNSVIRLQLMEILKSLRVVCSSFPLRRSHLSCEMAEMGRNCHFVSPECICNASEDKWRMQNAERRG